MTLVYYDTSGQLQRVSSYIQILIDWLQLNENCRLLVINHYPILDNQSPVSVVNIASREVTLWNDDTYKVLVAFIYCPYNQ